MIGDLSRSPELDLFKLEVKRQQLDRCIRVFDSAPHEYMPVFYREIAASSGLLLSTSFTEGYQNAVIEAMACGCPVVSTRSGGNSDIITHSRNGFLFDGENSKEAINYIDVLTTNKALRDKMIRQARLKVAADNNENAVTDKFLAMCDGLSGQLK